MAGGTRVLPGLPGLIGLLVTTLELLRVRELLGDAELPLCEPEELQTFADLNLQVHRGEPCVGHSVKTVVSVGNG